MIINNISQSVVTGSRHIANPNYGFQQQLQEWCRNERWSAIDQVKRWTPPVPVVYNDDIAAINDLVGVLCQGKNFNYMLLFYGMNYTFTEIGYAIVIILWSLEFLNPA